MNFKKTVESRWSVRDFDNKKQVTDEQLKSIFDLVKLSPSSYNLQPWKFIVIRDLEKKKLLRKCALDQKHVEEASATIIVLGNLNPLEHAGEILGERVKIGYYSEERKQQTIEKIKVLAKDNHRVREWSIRSTSLAAMSLMLAAKSIGLDTCPMEGFDEQLVKQNFNISESYVVVMLVPIGYALNEQPKRLKRFGFDEIVSFESE